MARDWTGSAWRRGASVMVLTACFALLSARVGYGQQTDPSPWFARVGFDSAFVMADNPFSLSGAITSDRNIQSTPSVTIEMGRQTDGSREWHHLYGLPSYGIGVSFGSIGDGISRPVDAYTFFSWPFARPSDRVQVTTDFGMGVSWNWKAYNARTNSYATVLGSDVNARIDWGFYLRYILTERASVYAGLDYTHRSNGGTKVPDFGINVIGPSVAVRYNLTPERHQAVVRAAPHFRPAWEFALGALGGPKNVADRNNPGVGHNFGAIEVTTDVQRHFYRYGKVAVGTDVTYNGATDVLIETLDAARPRRAPFGDRFALGVHGGYEHVIGRFGALVQVGYTLVNGSNDPKPRLYERYGWRYQLSDKYWAAFAIRSIRHRADFLEFGLGYKISR